MRGNLDHVEPSRRRVPGPRGPARRLLLLLLLALPVPAAAQAGADEVQVAVAALPVLRKSLPAGAAALDPEAFCRARLVGWACPAPLQNAAGSLGFRLNSRTFVHVCMGGQDSCRLVGAESLLVLEKPQIRQNSATLEAQVWWQSGAQGSAPSHRRVRLSLARRSGAWTVVDQDGSPD